MKKILLLSCVIVFVSTSTFAQRRMNRSGLYGVPENTFSVNLSSGLSYYFGDAERSWMFSQYSSAQTNFYVQSSLSYSFWPYAKLRANIIYAKLSGARASYSFKSGLFEPDFLIEAHPFGISSPMDFYLFTGVGIALSNIDAYDIAYDYRRTLSFSTPVIPLGLGYTYTFGSGFQLGADFGFRFATTDSQTSNLDGFPYTYNYTILRGEASRFIDIYYTLGITVGYLWSF